MKLNCDQTILNVYGKPIMEVDPDVEQAEGQKPATRPMTLGSVIAASMLAMIDRDRNLAAKDKAWRWAMAQRCLSGTVELTVEDAGKLTERIGAVCPTSWAGPAIGMIEAAAEK